MKLLANPGQGVVGSLLGILVVQNIIDRRSRRKARETNTREHDTVLLKVTLIEERQRVMLEKFEDVPPRVQELESTVFGSGHDGDTGLVSKAVASHKVQKHLIRDMDLVKMKHPDWPWPRAANQ
jgi:hypothetical protein